MTQELTLVTPLTNRGDTKPVFNPCPAAQIDWFTCTYHSSALAPKIFERFFEKFCCRYVVRRARFVSSDVMRNGFENTRKFILKDEAACFAYGGNKGFVMVEFRGAMCSYLTGDAWRLVRWFVRRYKARLTRLDIAGDFYQGEIDQAYIERTFKRDPSRIINVNGPVPNFGTADMGSGRTLYIGGRTSPRQICIYQKGKQLGKDQFPDWVRIELRWRRQKDKFEIPDDALLEENWWSYLAGLGPYFQRVCPATSMKKATYLRKQVHADINTQYQKMLSYMRCTFGKFFWLHFTLFPDLEAIKLLVKEGEWGPLGKVPDWQSDYDLHELITSTALGTLYNDLDEDFNRPPTAFDEDSPGF